MYTHVVSHTHPTNWFSPLYYYFFSSTGCHVILTHTQRLYVIPFLLNICCRKTKKIQIITQFIIPQNVVLSSQRKLPEKNFENGDRERKKKRNVNDRRVFFTVCIQNWCAVGEKERIRDTMTLYNNANYFN